MRRRTSLTTAACALAAATLLLTACGGGGDDKKIGAEDSGTSAPAPSASTTTAAPTTSAPAGPTFDFPPDVKVVVDADTTGDAVKDAVLRDQGYGLRAIYLGIAKLDSTLPVFQKYLTGKAASDWITNIDWGKSHHTSITGTTAFYNRKVTVTDATTAGVTFCESARDAYDKDTKTGKTATTTPSLDDFALHTARMKKSADGTWQMTDYRTQSREKSCER